jgi:hypothetical protein
MNCAGYIYRLLKTHGWDTESSKTKKPEPSPDPSSDQSPAPSLFQDCMKSSKPIAPIPADCIEQLFKDASPPGNTAAHKALECIKSFSYRTLLGELMYVYTTFRPDIGYANTSLSKFSSAPAMFHHKLLQGVAKYLCSTMHWGIRYKRSKSLPHLPTGEPYIELQDDPNNPFPVFPIFNYCPGSQWRCNPYKAASTYFHLVKKHVLLKGLVSCLNRSLLGQFLREICPFKNTAQNTMPLAA